MTSRLTRTVLRLLALFLVVVLAVGLFTAAKNQGLLSPLGIASESHDSQVIQAIERTQEVSLLSLGIQGIKDEERSREIFGTSVPGSGETVFVQYNFTGKLGLDGSKVEIANTGANGYSISIPDFQFIGYDEPTFKVAAEDGGALSWITPDIDTLEMVNEILGDEARQNYLDTNEELLKEQAEFFYDSLITGIDPAAETTYEFSS